MKHSKRTFAGSDSSPEAEIELDEEGEEFEASSFSVLDSEGRAPAQEGRRACRFIRQEASDSDEHDLPLEMPPGYLEKSERPLERRPSEAKERRSQRAESGGMGEAACETVSMTCKYERPLGSRPELMKREAARESAMDMGDSTVRSHRGRPDSGEGEKPAMARPSRVKKAEGEELRGYVVRLYPRDDEWRYLLACQRELMDAWNSLCLSRETHVEHCVRFAEDGGLVGPRPEKPAEEAPEEEWAKWRKACGERRYEAIRLALEQPGLGWQDWRVSYQRLRDLFGGKGTPGPGRIARRRSGFGMSGAGSVATAQMFNTLVQRFQRTKTPQFKRAVRRMPLTNGSGHLLELSELTRGKAPGERLRGLEKRCIVRWGPFRIPAIAHRMPQGPFIEGIAIRQEADGWYASAKCRVSPAVLPEPSREAIAINVGLEVLYADSEGALIDNPRGSDYVAAVSRMSQRVSLAENAGDEFLAERRRNDLRRFEQKMTRRVNHVIYSEVLPRLLPYRTIVLGESPDPPEGFSGRRRPLQGAAQGPQCRRSVYGEGGYVSAMSRLHELVRQRYGFEGSGRQVVAQSSVGISSRCSYCGTEHKSRYRRGARNEEDLDRRQLGRCPVPGCPSGGLGVHVDVNAARNLLSDFHRARDGEQAAE